MLTRMIEKNLSDHLQTVSIIDLSFIMNTSNNAGSSNVEQIATAV